ncbi:sporulation protein YunB [Alkalihalobacterium bogoriense]|uniref:sporulation protein YunB n=1 Tax=Alkalihalobacterium bogoriense TaxID=246272 RepID=UPI001FDFFA34|nr:sporulation protein YunB [Alkalihalobacterium bogoriense]
MLKIKKTRPKKRGPLPFRYVFLLSFIIFTLLTVQGLWLVEKGIRPTLMYIAVTETQTLATAAINDAINKKIVEEIDVEELMIIDRDESGRISSMRINTQLSTRIMAEATMRAQNYLRLMEQGRMHELAIPDGVDVEWNNGNQSFSDEGIIHNIPLGQATDNALLAHLGPSVPVKFSAIGNVITDMRTETEYVGINNTAVTLYLDIEVDVRVIIPFATEKQVVPTSIPIGYIFISGDVPEFYNVGGEGPSPAFFPSSQNPNQNTNDRDEIDVIDD